MGSAMDDSYLALTETEGTPEEVGRTVKKIQPQSVGL